MSSVTSSPPAVHAALRSVLGDRARLMTATASDSVAGLQPWLVVEPSHEEEVAAVLAFADREGLKVLVRGGGTQLGLGFPPTGGHILLQMTGLAEVVEHTPGDLTVTVQAGCRLTALQAALAGARQWLALDPGVPPPATIGGIVATNASGPRRLRYGGVRDQIIGVRIVRPDGTIAKGGGKVVKNVAGYDLPKLITGSLGTLGVITSATFRLYPQPAGSRTVVLTAAAPAPLCDLAMRVLGSPLVPAAMDVAGPVTPGTGCRLAVCFETVEVAAEDQAQRLLGLAGPLGETAQVLRGEAEAQLWRAAATDVVGPAGATAGAEPALVLKASVLPTEVAPWLERLQHLVQETGLTARWRAHAGHGLIRARIAGPAAALVPAVDELRAAASRCRGGLAVEDGPPAVTRQLDVWGPSPALEVMRRLKAQFDPHATLNPGRFVGGL